MGFIFLLDEASKNLGALLWEVTYSLDYTVFRGTLVVGNPCMTGGFVGGLGPVCVCVWLGTAKAHKYREVQHLDLQVLALLLQAT